ncbi:MAG: right-handed parallel beta-helix repeat-containing protein [Saprospiraceae bacterium]|nr:right-handed parallel beta-helix repeat-containing protein [Saprospiraceae bacterium]
MRFLFLPLCGLLFLLASCSPTGETFPLAEEVYQNLQEQLILAEPGDTIDIPEGKFRFDRPLSLDGIKNFTIRGAGMDKSVLSFLGQRAGAEGLKITADSITLEGFTIQDTQGDAIKLQDCSNVVIRNVHTTWTGGVKASNGGYGLYPVACQYVLIENCEASYASDAGIYVGQSQDVIVRNCYAHHNVAGIEIENCTRSEVYGNRAEENTGGILVFDLPDLPVVNGKQTKVYDNQIKNNNLKNFAPKGNIVGIVPPGTGIILLAAKEVEIYDNEISGHKTIGTAIASYQITEKPWNNQDYDPYTYAIDIRNNYYTRKKALPDLSSDFGKMVNLIFKGKPQDILYDGIVSDTQTSTPNPMGICIEQNTEDLRFANIDAANDFNHVQTDVSLYSCK